MVSKEKQIWHCFGCGEGGDVFGFVMKIEGMEFPEALRILANKAGVKLERQDPVLASQRTRLLDILELAAKFYHKILLESKEGQIARDYIKGRELKDETVENFLLGFAPCVEEAGWDLLNKYLVQKGFTENEIFLAGLSIKKERGSGFYDRFRGRIIFPIADLHGNIVGFTARVLPQFDDGKMGKYINTPQTMIYNKSQVLYGLDKAKQEIRKKDLAVIVEGNMDVIASHQAGVTNVVASSGTALTLEQIKLLKRYSPNLALSFDADPAGDQASERGIDTALREAMNIRMIVIPSGKDPDECIRKNPEDWTKAIRDAKSIMEYYFDKTLAKSDLAKVEDKKKVAKILLTAIAKLADKVEQTHWLQKLSEILNVPEQILWDALNKQKKPAPAETPSKPEAKPKTMDHREMELGERLMSFILKFPLNLEYAIHHLEPTLLPGDDLNELYKELVIYYTEIGEFSFDFEEFRRKMALNNKKLADLTNILLMLGDKDLAELNAEEAENEIVNIIKYLKRDYISREIKKLESEIKKADKDKNLSVGNDLIQEFNKLIEELAKLNKE
jgi:DNA primase